MATAFKDQEISTRNPTGADLLRFMLENEEKILGKFLPVSAGATGKFSGDKPNPVIKRLMELIRGKRFPTASPTDMRRAAEEIGDTSRTVSAITDKPIRFRSTPGSLKFLIDERRLERGVNKLAGRSTGPRNNAEIVSNIRSIFNQDPAFQRLTGGTENAIRANIRAFKRFNPEFKNSPENEVLDRILKISRDMDLLR